MMERDLLIDQLRHMIAALEQERQALATLDLEELVRAVKAKESLCASLELYRSDTLGEETRSLASTARQLNDVNRRVRNLLAANVTARLEHLGIPQEGYGPRLHARTG